MRDKVLIILIMALVTYVIRAIPIVFLNKKIESKWIRSFLEFTPYAVLGAMTFPNIIYSTGNITAAIIGFIIAIILAYMEKSLVTVALSAVTIVYIVILAI